MSLLSLKLKKKKRKKKSRQTRSTKTLGLKKALQLQGNLTRHFEAKLCILCIVSGFRNRPKSDLSRNSQHCYFSLIFFAVLDFTNKYLKHCTAQNRSKNTFAESRTICRIHKQIIGHVYR